jgi:hypothetical protein
MKPILLIHGYSSEGKNNKVEDIYGSLPAQLRATFGDENVRDLNLSRWISLNDGISLDDVSFAMDRALRARFADLLASGFHVIIHSTGALVVRNWIKNYNPEPGLCPIENIVHLAGAHFGSGLAHVGKGQLTRWARLLALHTGSGTRVLDELLFGSWKSLDLAQHFLAPNKDMFDDYHVQEFCIIGSQIPKVLRSIPIRYIREDSSDNTVRTSAGNLNFSHVVVTPKPGAFSLSIRKLSTLMDQRLNGERIDESYYDIDFKHVSANHRAIPFAIAYETAHFGDKIGIVAGSRNRKAVMPLIKIALSTPYDANAYQQAVQKFEKARLATFKRAGGLSRRWLEWNVQKQYEGHAQLIFRIRDQFGDAVEFFDITFRSRGETGSGRTQLESLIEDRRNNRNHGGTMTFYLRTQRFEDKQWTELLENLRPLDVEITGTEPQSSDIEYLPLKISLTGNEVATILKSFQTTVIDIQLARLPSQNVFKVTRV